MTPAAMTLSYWHLPSVLVSTDLGLLTLDQLRHEC
jgi:hypothetical protein